MKKTSLEISASSRRDIKKTEAYLKLVELIKEQIHQKYQNQEASEKSLFKKLILKIQRGAEIRRSVEELTSKDKLYMIK